jgi:phosphatidylserine/phosphatidylglycerophosphate/cardiolipin synthase-like enzyme
MFCGSLRQNLEVNAVIVEPSFGASLEKLFAEDLEQCQRVTIEHVRSSGLFERALSWVAFRLRHWL